MLTSSCDEEDSSLSDTASTASTTTPQHRDRDRDRNQIIQNMLTYYPTDDDGDGDSAYGEDSLIGDDTMTLDSYITDYRYEFGRRYHSYHDGAYWVGRYC